MAKMDRCPICGVAVRPENLRPHLNDTHPKHPDTAKLVGELKADRGRVATRPPARPIRISRLQASIVLVVILAGVGGYFLLPYLSPPSPPFACVGGAGLAYHWHTQLSITSGGNAVTIPANIGISPNCLEVLHTHTTDGVIHIEPDTPEQARVYTIGDFFQVWGKPFGFPTRMVLNGTAIPPSSTVGLYDRPETIELDYASFTP